MKLIVDVGNTHTVLGVTKKNEIQDKYRIQTVPGDTSDEIWMKWKGLLGEKISREMQVLVASVVPDISTAIRDIGDTYLKNDPWFLTPPWKETSIQVATDNPAEVGADRIAGAIAIHERFDSGIVVDFGTATTIDIVDEGGIYRGGVIFPGLRASATGLHSKAAKLPLISPRKPTEFSCSNTRDSLESGLFYGITGAVEHLLKKLKNNFSLQNDISVVATGGAAASFVDLTPEITCMNQNLVLEGLLLCYDK